jgi:hypothetical protein
MNSNRKNHPLTGLHDKNVNDFRLHLGEVKQLRLSGWKGFKLYLRNPQNIISTSPVIKGIYSSGGKDGVQSWMDLDYRDEIQFQYPQNGQEKYTLSTSESGSKLFSLLGYLIPPGGHLMISYEGDQQIHAETVKSLSLGIPAAVTPLGYLLYKGGFQYIKDWYLAEGGFEGPRKLWGEKAPDDSWRLNYMKRTALQIDTFLQKTFSSSYGDLVEPARKRANEIVEIIQKNQLKDVKGNTRSFDI